MLDYNSLMMSALKVFSGLKLFITKTESSLFPFLALSETKSICTTALLEKRFNAERHRGFAM